eukprot:SAG22_NODE_3604_length_1619_cov_1.377632_1_plen_210_part_00
MEQQTPPSPPADGAPASPTAWQPSSPKRDNQSAPPRLRQTRAEIRAARASAHGEGSGPVLSASYDESHRRRGRGRPGSARRKGEQLANTAVAVRAVASRGKGQGREPAAAGGQCFASIAAAAAGPGAEVAASNLRAGQMIRHPADVYTVTPAAGGLPLRVAAVEDLYPADQRMQRRVPFGHPSRVDGPDGGGTARLSVGRLPMQNELYL